MARPKFRRYLSDGYEMERRDAGLTSAQVIVKTQLRYEAAIASGVTERQVERLGLDDPFLSDHASAQQLWIASRKKVAQ